MRYAALTILLAAACLPLLVFRLAAPSLVGRVEEDSGPAAGARVRVKGTALVASSDATGRFRLPCRPPARITAWKEGYLIAGVDAGRTPAILRLQRLPAEDFEDYAWVEPGPKPADEHNCVTCHR